MPVFSGFVLTPFQANFFFTGGLKSIGMGLGSGGAPITNFNQLGSSKLIGISVHKDI